MDAEETEHKIDPEGNSSSSDSQVDDGGVEPKEDPRTSTASASIESQETLAAAAAAEEDGAVVSYTSHFRNADAHPNWLRYGVPTFLFGTFLLLLNADIGSGIKADYLLRGEEVIVESRSLFKASIFTSVGKLWENGSYPLAILIVIASVGWPYIKLGLLAYSWLTPFRTYARRRERLLEVLDILGKWSFVDIVVLVEVIVAFRATIVIARGVYLEIVIVPEWGFYGFVVATILSFVATEIILYHHRKVVYPPVSSSTSSGLPGAIFSTKHKIISTFFLLCAFSVYLVGCILDVYIVGNTRGKVSFEDHYSVVSVGTSLSDAEYGGAGPGLGFIQFLWFLLCMVAPLLSCVGFAILNAGITSSLRWQRIVFMAAEAANAWSCAEVFVVSTIVAILQLPTFGEGLVDADCSFCFVIDSRLKNEFAVICVGMVVLVLSNFWLYRASHRRLYEKLR